MALTAEIAGKLRDNLQQLLERRAFHEKEVTAIGQELQETSVALATMGTGVRDTPKALDIPKVLEERETLDPTAKGDIKGLALDILEKSPVPLSVDELAIQMMKVGYKTDTADNVDFINKVYNEAIMPNIHEGLIEAVGDRRTRKYRLIPS